MSFLRPHLDYGNVLYDQPNNESLCRKIESVQCNATLAIMGAIKGTFKIKLYIVKWGKKRTLQNVG